MPRKRQHHLRNTQGLRNQHVNQIKGSSDDSEVPNEGERSTSPSLPSTEVIVNENAECLYVEPESADNEDERNFKEDLESMANLARGFDDDPVDGSWVPSTSRQSKRAKTERPKTYAKGPDILGKSARTQRRYRNQKGWVPDMKLDGFGFKLMARASPRQPATSHKRDPPAPAVHNPSAMTQIPPYPDPEPAATSTTNIPIHK